METHAIACAQVDRAVAISWRNMRVNAFDASVIPAARFFDAMVASSTYYAHLLNRR